jgi:NTE family protein
MKRSIFVHLFDRPGVARLRIAGGQPLYEAGARADALYLVVAGAFAVFRAVSGGRSLLGLVRPGEIVGEAAVLAGTARSATVVALRDSVVALLPSPAFFDAARRDPEVMTEVARLLIRRAQSAGAAPRYTPPKVIALSGLGGRSDARALADQLARALRALGRTVALLGAEAIGQTPSWWSTVEDEHDFVLCAIEAEETAWSAVCRRQADRMLIVGHSADPPPAECPMCASEPLRMNALVDLVLMHDGSRPMHAGVWLDTVAPGRLHHLPAGDDCARLARSLPGGGVALVLSGGGARAFAHIGAVRALRRAGVTIDAVCGTSMGAIVAAGVAAGWDDREMDERMQAAFVTSNPLDDVSLPFVAMTRGCKVDRRLAEHFCGWDIADLPLPFFCVSADLGTGSHVAHRRGPLPIALRASISLPGVLPPVTVGDQVLVDGGTLLNLPSALMRAGHDGTVVAVDVSRSQGLMPDDVLRPHPMLHWFWSGGWRRGPPIISILMRSATIAAEPELRAAREAADLYVMPEVGDIEIRNWRAYHRAVGAGDEAMSRALDALEAPVERLRADREQRAAAMPM